MKNVFFKGIFIRKNGYFFEKDSNFEITNDDLNTLQEFKKLQKLKKPSLNPLENYAKSSQSYIMPIQ